jgi:hypothetical protein
MTSIVYKVANRFEVQAAQSPAPADGVPVALITADTVTPLGDVGLPEGFVVGVQAALRAQPYVAPTAASEVRTTARDFDPAVDEASVGGQPLTQERLEDLVSSVEDAPPAPVVEDAPAKPFSQAFRARLAKAKVFYDEQAAPRAKEYAAHAKEFYDEQAAPRIKDASSRAGVALAPKLEDVKRGLAAQGDKALLPLLGRQSRDLLMPQSKYLEEVLITRLLAMSDEERVDFRRRFEEQAASMESTDTAERTRTWRRVIDRHLR